jgi:hypothetical protein
MSEYPIKALREPWPNASEERLDVIEINECPPDGHSLCTRRFRRLFNEIAKLQAELARMRKEDQDKR